MPNYRRAPQPGGTFFFTVVTWNRRPLFAEGKSRALLRTAIETTRDRRPFTTDAVCLLPDHLHAVWTLPESDRDFSTRWAQIKGRFSHDWLAWVRSGGGGANPALNDGRDAGGAGLAPPTNPAADYSRPQRGEVKVWQPRFWEHLIRDDEDFRQPPRAGGAGRGDRGGFAGGPGAVSRGRGGFGDCVSGDRLMAGGPMWDGATAKGTRRA